MYSSKGGRIFAALQNNDSTQWSRINTSTILKRFKDAHQHVPAYKSFLNDQGIDPSKIKSTKDIAKIPPVSKTNYLRVHPWEALCIKGSLNDAPLVLTATSGSTGEPFYIPRTDEAHEAATVFHRIFVERAGLDPKKPTLVVVCFGMGVWIGGLLTYEAFRRISERGWPLTVITPGVSKKEIFDALRNIGPSHDQLILCGYPPFVKDVIDDGAAHGITWKQWDMRVICAAEGFSERFRDYVMRKTGMRDPYRSMMNIYGSAELGTMATETPLSILLRRLATKNKRLYSRLFSEAHRLPTLAQFIPHFVSFEAGDEGRVYATGGTALPFIRYDIGDNGGVFTYTDAVRICKETGIDLIREARTAAIHDTCMKLPFVYLYERADLSTKLYGAIVYPEHVKAGLQKRTFERLITGRFTMTTEHDADHNEHLVVNLELRPGVSDTKIDKDALVESIVTSLCASNSEYNNNHTSMRERVIPHLIFWPHEHPTYFKAGIKQKWVINSKK